MSRRRAPSECPVCGASVPANAAACPECGADERTGWNEEATRYDGLDLPDHAFENDAKPEGRFSMRDKVTSTGVPYFTWIVAVMLLLLIGAGFVTLVF